MKSKSLIPQENIEQWPEILQDIDVSQVPLEYISIMRLHFLDNRDVWEINISGQSKKQNFDEISEQVAELLTNFREIIDYIDIEINVTKVKKLITKTTTKFFKKTKI